MSKNLKNSTRRNYKDSFEFELTVGDNIICQRYFRINNFNEESLKSFELIDAVRKCVSTIDNDLKMKTQAYLEMYAPLVFNSKEDMDKYLSNPDNIRRITVGEGAVIKGDKNTDYVLGLHGDYKALGYKFDDGELSENLCEMNKVTYKFAFKVDGRETVSMIWDGYYPKFIRDKIDLSNKRGKFENEDPTRLSFEQYLLYKIFKGKSDLIYGIIMNICEVCSYPEGTEYITDKDEIMSNWRDSRMCDAFRIKS